MGDDTKRSKHKHSHDHDTERHSKRRHKHDDDSRRHKKKRKHGEDKGTKILDEGPGDEDMWVEKNIDMDGERVRLAISGRSLSEPLTASGNGYSHWRKLEVDFVCDSWVVQLYIPALDTYRKYTKTG